MKKFKSCFTFALIATVSFAMLTGCGKQDEVKEESNALPSSTACATIEPTKAPEVTVKPTEEPKVTEAPKATTEPTKAPEVTAAPTATPTAKPTATPKATATPNPTAVPTAVPTEAPTPEPEPDPTEAPAPEPPKEEPQATPVPESTKPPSYDIVPGPDIEVGGKTETPAPTPEPPKEAHVHSMYEIWISYPTCTTEGDVVCQCDCGYVDESRSGFVAALGHTLEGYTLSEGDCVAPKVTRYRCTVCGMDNCADDTYEPCPNPTHDWKTGVTERIDMETGDIIKVEVTQCSRCSASK